MLRAILEYALVIAILIFILWATDGGHRSNDYASVEPASASDRHR